MILISAILPILPQARQEWRLGVTGSGRLGFAQVGSGRRLVTRQPGCTLPHGGELLCSDSFRIHSEFIRNSFRFSYILICSGARSILWLSKPLPLLHKVPPKVLASGESSESVAGISAGIAVKQCKTRTCKSAHSQQPWCYYYIPTAGLVDSVKGGVLHSPSR